jgi:hypothetical protein
LCRTFRWPGQWLLRSKRYPYGRRNFQTERRALTRAAIDADGSPQEIHESFHDVKAKTEATTLQARIGAFGLPKPLENRRYLRGWDSDPAVGDLDL